MSADIKDDNQPYDDINITPMLDLAYVLLVIFIITALAYFPALALGPVVEHLMLWPSA